MEILTIIAFCSFFLLVLSLMAGILYSVYLYGFLRSFETKTYNWQLVVLILINIIIAWKLYDFI